MMMSYTCPTFSFISLYTSCPIICFLTLHPFATFTTSLTVTPTAVPPATGAEDSTDFGASADLGGSDFLHPKVNATNIITSITARTFFIFFLLFMFSTKNPSVIPYGSYLSLTVILVLQRLLIARDSYTIFNERPYTLLVLLRSKLTARH